MDGALTSLIAACVTLVGTHFAMSHPLRAPMVRAFGKNGFQIVYSLVSLGAVIWIYFAFKAVRVPALPLWAGFDHFSWVVGSVLSVLGTVLFVGSFRANPALAMPGAEEAARAEPTGVFRVTRHPMMWGFALIALGHLVAAPTSRTLVVMSAIIILALVGARLQDRKKAVLMGEAWHVWEAKTSFGPRWSYLLQVGPVLWLVAASLWLAITWAHTPAGGIPAGVWRWL
jgi:uncharacterized membrane protein